MAESRSRKRRYGPEALGSDRNMRGWRDYVLVVMSLRIKEELMRILVVLSNRRWIEDRDTKKEVLVEALLAET